MPNDVAAEQLALKSLVCELNDFLTFITPEKNVRLEVIHYETSVYPDVSGAPQLTVDRQIPKDYEIHFGIMWKRCGTPMKDADSGTVHEFELALKRREREGRPIIMFYFSDEKIGLPSNAAEFDQLGRVLKFRERLSSIGLTVVYPNADVFRERARIGLLRAVADLIRLDSTQQRRASEVGPPDDDPPSNIITLSDRYMNIRRDLSSGPARTQLMTAVFEEMIAMAPQSKRSLNQLIISNISGYRLAAIAVLQTFPDIDYIAWLADRLEPEHEAPFVGYHAAVALLQAARSFPSAFAEDLRREISRARQLATKNPNDPPRITALDYALKEIDLKVKKAQRSR